MPLLTNPADLDRVARVEARQVILLAAALERSTIAYALKWALLPRRMVGTLNPPAGAEALALAFERLFFVEPTDVQS